MGECARENHTMASKIRFNLSATKTRKEAVKNFKESGIIVSKTALERIVEEINPIKCILYRIEGRAIADTKERTRVRKANAKLIESVRKDYIASYTAGGWSTEAEWKMAWRALTK
jgi:hypothetical protein